MYTYAVHRSTAYTYVIICVMLCLCVCVQLLHAFAHICARTDMKFTCSRLDVGGWMFDMFNISIQSLCWITNDGSDESKDDTTCGPMQWIGNDGRRKKPRWRTATVDTTQS